MNEASPDVTKQLLAIARHLKRVERGEMVEGVRVLTEIRRQEAIVFNICMDDGDSMLFEVPWGDIRDFSVEKLAEAILGYLVLSKEDGTMQ